MTTILLQNTTEAPGFLLQNVTVLLQFATVITKCVGFITKCDGYYNLRRLLQNASVQSLFKITSGSSFLSNFLKLKR